MPIDTFYSTFQEPNLEKKKRGKDTSECRDAWTKCPYLQSCCQFNMYAICKTLILKAFG